MGNHPANRPLNHKLGAADQTLFKGFGFVASNVTGEAGVYLSGCLLSGNANLGSVDDHHMVSRVAVRRKNSFVFAAQDIGDFRGNASENLVLGIHDPPITVDFFCFGGKCFHNKISHEE